MIEIYPWGGDSDTDYSRQSGNSGRQNFLFLNPLGLPMGREITLIGALW